MKWFIKLTKMEILDFWKTIDKNIENKISIELFGDFAYVYFYELGWGDIKEGVATRYKFTDFSVEYWEAYVDEAEAEKTKEKYLLFMAKKFGNIYIANLLEHETGVTAEKWLKLIG